MVQVSCLLLVTGRFNITIYRDETAGDARVRLPHPTVRNLACLSIARVAVQLNAGAPSSCVLGIDGTECWVESVTPLTVM